MKNIKTPFKTLFLATITFVTFACGPKNENSKIPVSQEKEEKFILDKLLGTWKNTDGKSFERWKKNADGTYSSDVYIFNEKDTLFIENATVFEEHGKWIFKNKVQGQNDGRTVRFTSGELSEDQIQFRNPQHDFPNEINYTLSDENTLNAFIVGKNEKGGMDTIPFSYLRLK